MILQKNSKWSHSPYPAYKLLAPLEQVTRVAVVSNVSCLRDVCMIRGFESDFLRGSTNSLSPCVFHASEQISSFSICYCYHFWYRSKMSDRFLGRTSEPWHRNASLWEGEGRYFGKRERTDFLFLPMFLALVFVFSTKNFLSHLFGFYD